VTLICTGNIGASVGEDGIGLVDDGVAPLAEVVQAKLKGIADKPVRFIFVTHYHDDHVGGNELFKGKRRSSLMTSAWNNWNKTALEETADR